MREMTSLFSMLNSNMWTYPTDLGRLEVNLRSLEVKIRIFLLILDKGYREAGKFNKSLRKLKIGQEVEKNPFTKYSHFSDLINEYNRVVSSSHILYGCKIDSKLISFRNALAHGRFFYKNLSPPYKTMLLLQFRYPKRNNPIVEFHKKLSTGWLNKKIKWTFKENQKVEKACWIIEKLRPN